MKRMLLIAVAAVVVMLVSYELQSVATDSSARPAKVRGGTASLDSPQSDNNSRKSLEARSDDKASVRAAKTSASVDPRTKDLTGRAIKNETVKRSVEARPGASRIKASERISSLQPTEPVESTPPSPANAVTNADALRGLSHAQVQERLGEPTLTYRGVWHYETRAGTLRVYFENGHVTQSLPADFELSSLPRR